MKFNNTLIVIATYNGIGFLPALLEDLKAVETPYLIVDTGSTDPTFVTYLEGLKDKDSVIFLPNGGCLGAYWFAAQNLSEFQSYFFMHDSMRIKEPNFLTDFKAMKRDVVAWIGFPMDMDEDQALFLSNFDLLPSNAPTAIFGPIFYATREAMLNARYPHYIVNRDQLTAIERGLGIAFHQAGYTVDAMEPYDNDRLDKLDDYHYFTKYRPNRE